MMRYCLLLLLLMNFTHASSDVLDPRKMHWAFDRMFGGIDKDSAIKGFKVYKEVCAACHSLKLIPFRELENIGFSKQEVAAIASGYSIKDGPNSDGDMFTRPGRPSDYLPSPYPNDEAGKAANNGVLPPDLSLMIKARENGANYVYSLLTGYSNPPEGVNIRDGLHYNPYFPTHAIAMPKPLSDGVVEFDNGAPNAIHDMAYDVVNFLQWASDPTATERKRVTSKSVIISVLLAVSAYAYNKAFWKKNRKQ